MSSKILNKKAHDLLKYSFKFRQINHPVTSFDFDFQYPSTRKGYQYCFSVSGNRIMLYLFKGDDSNYEDWEFVGFVDYFETPINKLHKTLKSQNGDITGSIKFLEKCVDTFKYIDSLPKEEDIEDLLIYLEEDGIKISSIDYGFEDTGSEMNFYTIPDTDSGHIKIFVSLDPSGEHTIVKIKDLVQSCMKRAKFYFADSYSDFSGFEVKLTSWESPFIIFRFKNNI